MKLVLLSLLPLLALSQVTLLQSTISARVMPGIVFVPNIGTLIVGGYDSTTGDALSDAFLIAPGSQTVQVASTLPYAVAEVAAVATKINGTDAGLFCGGTPDGNNTFYSTCFYTADGHTFTTMSGTPAWANPPVFCNGVTGFAGMSIARTGDASLVLTGGYNSADTSTCDLMNNPLVYKSLDGGATWSQISDTTSTNATVRSWHNSVVNPSTGELLILAGWMDDGTDTGKELNDVWSSTDGGVTFQKVTVTAAFTARDSASAFYISSNTSTGTSSMLYLTGGEDDNLNGGVFYDDVWHSSDNGVTWTQQTTSVSTLVPGFLVGTLEASSGAVILAGDSGAPYGEAVLRFAQASTIGSAGQQVSTVTPTSPGAFVTTQSAAAYGLGNDGTASIASFGFLFLVSIVAVFGSFV